MASKNKHQAEAPDGEDLSADVVLSRTFWVTITGVVLFVAAALYFAIGAEL